MRASERKRELGGARRAKVSSAGKHVPVHGRLQGGTPKRGIVDNRGVPSDKAGEKMNVFCEQ